MTLVAEAIAPLPVRAHFHDTRNTAIANVWAAIQAGATVVDSFNDLAPDIGRAIIEHSYGDIFSRAGLNAITRELAACSALAAVGSKATQTPLRVHVNAALTAGATPAEIVETLLNVLPYRGYPAVEESMRVAGEEFRKRGDNGQKAAAERQ